MVEIKVIGLKKYFADRLLLDIDKLVINSGDRVGIVGVNGSGKSTLLNMIAGKDTDYEGEVYINNNF